MRGLLTLAAAMAFVAVPSAPVLAQDAPAASAASPVVAPPLAPPPVVAAPDAPGAPRPQGLSESVVVTVNDDLISTYDIVQRMRLLIVTAGIQPTEQNIPDIQREAVRSLVDEHLEMRELRDEGKTQKFDLVASDQEVDDEIAQIARSNNTSAAQLLAQLAAQGVGSQTFRDQLRAEISWRGWIRGRYGQRLVIGDDQIKAFQKRLEAEAGKPQFQIAEVFIDASRAGGQAQAQQGAEQLSAANGGDVGWVSTGEMAPEVDQALENLRPGQLSAPIPVKDGVYIVFLKDRRAGGSATVVKLKQAAIALSKDATPEQVAAAQATLMAMQPKIQGCDNLETVAAKTPGVVAGDLGEADTKDLAPAFKQVADTLQPGQVSQPVRTDAGLHLIAVCDKHAGGADQMTRDQIEDRLYGQELSMIAKRQLRDLRNSATIETR